MLYRDRARRPCDGEGLTDRFGENSINVVISRPRRAVLTASAGILVLGGGIAACGTVEQLSAADKVARAAEKIGESKSLTAEVSLQATPDELVAFGKASGDPIERKNAEAIAGLKLTVSMSADKPLKDTGAFKGATASQDVNPLTALKGVDVAYTVASKKGHTYADLRIIDEKVYAKIDLKGFAELTGEDTGEFDQMASVFGSDDKVMKTLLDGGWISLDPAVVEQFTKLATEEESGGDDTSGTPSAEPTLDAKTTQRLTDAVRDVITKNVTFQDKGSKDGTDHIHVSAPARSLVDGMLRAVRPIAADVPEFPALPTAVPSDVPDRTVGVDLDITKGALSGITFDLAQLDDGAKADAHLPVKLTLNGSAPAPTAPTGAVAVTEKDIEGLGGFPVPGLAGSGDDATGAGPGEVPGLGDFSPEPAPPLTDAQIKELVAAGMDAEEAKSMNRFGMTFEDLKDMAKYSS